MKHCQRLVSFIPVLPHYDVTGHSPRDVTERLSISSTASSTGPQTEQTGPQTELQDKSAAEKGVKVTILEIQPPAGQSSAEEKTGAEADAGSGAEAAGQGETSAAETQPPASDQAAEEEWQGKVTFPDWKGYTDDTPIINIYRFLVSRTKEHPFSFPQGKLKGFTLFYQGFIYTPERKGREI